MASNSGSLISMLDSIDGNSFTDETERSAAMNAAAALQSRLEQPWETALKYSWMVVRERIGFITPTQYLSAIF